ncbi:hypothetical protein HMPREF9621_01493 [Cutibacterium modestum HL037PA2]|uniref:Uncharacterized protein n=1 Tax=Cutibacterium modestum HL044PA1 TaxID=765109 RepID=A0ABN0C681_9ACTN|nr:hypothetical protein HMPREF9621_01493 [Cutibacterium modestum HL037PA2]EFS92724.1 hypothetical protein HMPREF9607_01066 [Cutibacterium modestum HL044PA1]
MLFQPFETADECRVAVAWCPEQRGTVGSTPTRREKETPCVE